MNSSRHWRRNASQSNGATVRNAGRPMMNRCSSVPVLVLPAGSKRSRSVIHSRSSAPSLTKPGRAVSTRDASRPPRGPDRDLDRPGTGSEPVHPRVAGGRRGPEHDHAAHPLADVQRRGRLGAAGSRACGRGLVGGGGALLAAAGRAAERHHGGRHAEEKRGHREPTRPRPRAVDRPDSSLVTQHRDPPDQGPPRREERPRRPAGRPSILPQGQSRQRHEVAGPAPREPCAHRVGRQLLLQVEVVPPSSGPSGDSRSRPAASRASSPAA